MFRRLLENQPVLRIAFVHLVSKKRQTIVAMLGVMFGIMVFIFQAGLITGLQIYMLDKLVNNNAHVHLYTESEQNPQPILNKVQPPGPNDWVVVRHQRPKEISKKIKNAYGLMAELERRPEVVGVAPTVATQAIIKLGIKELPVTISGVEIAKENQLYNIGNEVVSGHIMELETNSAGIVLGVGVAQKLGASVGDLLALTTTNTRQDMKVVAITQSGITVIDDTRATVNLKIAQRLMGVDMLYITDLNVKMKDPEKADEFGAIISRQYGYKAQSWKEANAGIFGVFKIQNLATLLVIVSILVVAGFGIYNILTMMIYEKMTDIAILKSVGFRNRDIRKLFMIEALVIGFIGGILGLISGYIASVLASQIEVSIKGLVTLNRLVINFDPKFYAAGFLFGLVSTAIAGYIPAVKASKVDPVEIIRGKF